MSFKPFRLRSSTAGIPLIGCGSSTLLRTMRSRPARSVMRMPPSGRNARPYGRCSPFNATTLNFGPGIGLPLGPRVELSKMPGLSGSVSRAGAGACCACSAVKPIPTAAVIARMGFNMGELYAESWTSEDLRISRDRPAIVSAMAPWALKPGETLHHLRRRAEAGGRTGGCRGRDHLPDAGPESTRQGVRTYYIKDHYLN